MPGIEYFIFRILRKLRNFPVNPLSIGNSKKIFAEYFKDFDKVAAVRGIFGEKTTEILSHLTVELSWFNGYMYVDGADGHLVISKSYLNSGNRTDIYLDLIHELCHVKQFMDGKELFDPRYEYVDRPTEIEAYRYTVREARRLGLSEERIRHYLKTEWMSQDDFERLAKYVHVSSC
ncbi:MAG: hypothetical protein M1540_02085 [Candidatus Bathyarchaeota archaeon]|nr:hypothetical protein [Candidatus Bathyarchaeota archaeon]